MILDTNEIEHDFTVLNVDEFRLINTREIGVRIASMFFDKEEIWESEMLHEIQKYFDGFILTAFEEAENVLKDNGRKIDVRLLK